MGNDIKIKEQITKRFMELVEHLKRNGVFKTYKEFCEQINILPQNFNEIKKGNRAVTVDMLYRFSELYNVRTEYLFFEKRPRYSSPPIEEAQMVEEALISYPQSNIDLKSLFLNPDTRYYPIEGNAMEPNFFNGDWAVGILTTDFQLLRGQEIYGITTKAGEIYVRRINFPSPYTQIELIPEIPDPSTTLSIPVQQIAEISKIKYRFTGQIDKSSFNNGLQRIEQKLDELLLQRK